MRNSWLILGLLILVGLGSYGCAAKSQPNSPEPSKSNTQPSVSESSSLPPPGPNKPGVDQIPAWLPTQQASAPTLEQATAAVDKLFAAVRQVIPGGGKWNPVTSIRPNRTIGICEILIKQERWGEPALVTLDLAALNRIVTAQGFTAAKKLLYDVGGNTHFIADGPAGSQLTIEAKTLVIMQYRAVLADAACN